MRGPGRIAAALLLVTVAIACGADAPTSPGRTAELASPCLGLCERIAACGPSPDFPGIAACTQTCETAPEQVAGPCREPRIAYERCMTAAPCEDVRASSNIRTAEGGPCVAEREAVLTCAPPDPPTPFIQFQF